MKKTKNNWRTRKKSVEALEVLKPVTQKLAIKNGTPELRQKIIDNLRLKED